MPRNALCSAQLKKRSYSGFARRSTYRSFATPRNEAISLECSRLIHSRSEMGEKTNTSRLCDGNTIVAITLGMSFYSISLSELIIFAPSARMLWRQKDSIFLASEFGMIDAIWSALPGLYGRNAAAISRDSAERNNTQTVGRILSHEAAK